MKTLIALTLALFAVSAGATNPPQKPTGGPTERQEQHQNANGGAGYGGAGFGGSVDFNDSRRGYVFPGLSLGGPALPGGLCPMNDRLAWGIGWNFFWVDQSTVRTDMACLDAVLSVVKSHPVKTAVLPPLKPCETLHPPKKPVKKPAKVCK